jgi:hypothetical protein
MEKPSQSMFARALFHVVRILTQILTSWLVVNLIWNTRVVLLVLKVFKNKRDNLSVTF